MTIYLGCEKTILSLGNLQLRRSQCQPAHVELQVLEDLVLESNQFQNFFTDFLLLVHLVLQSGHGPPRGAPVDTPGVEGSDDQALGADAERVALDHKLHHLGGEQKEVLAPQQLLSMDVDGLKAGECELFK